jgi:hypothetical protein
MSDELKEHNISKLMLIVRFACATLDVGHPIVSSHPSIQLKFCLADGDQSCQTYFDEEFDQLLPGTSQILDLSPVVESISKRHHLFIGDFLHIHKNARTRLLNRNVH